jgi:hypothetical protein
MSFWKRSSTQFAEDKRPIHDIHGLRKLHAWNRQMTSAARGSWWQHALVFAMQMRYGGNLRVLEAKVGQELGRISHHASLYWRNTTPIFSSVCVKEHVQK